MDLKIPERLEHSVAPSSFANHRLPATHLHPAPLTVQDLGPVLIVSPHPDDETLGCGGLIAQCATTNHPLRIVTLTNGDASHPGNHRWRARLAQIRWREQAAALKQLGLTEDCSEWFHQADGSLASIGGFEYEQLVARLAAVITRHGIESVFVTAIDERHEDHQFAALIAVQATTLVAYCQRLFSYPIWSAEIRAAELLRSEQPYVLNIQPWLARKRAAINEHRSQMGSVEMPAGGFQIPESLIEQKLQPSEPYNLITDPDTWIGGMATNLFKRGRVTAPSARTPADTPAEEPSV